MRQVKVLQVITAGVVATLVMTMVMYAAPVKAFLQVDLAALLGSLFSPQVPAPGSASWWLGMLGHVISGSIVFPLIYAAWFSRLGGMWWGVMIWVLIHGVVMLVAGRGVLSAKAPLPLISLMGSLLGYLMYGAILGKLVGDGTEREPPESDEANGPRAGPEQHG